MSKKTALAAFPDLEKLGYCYPRRAYSHDCPYWVFRTPDGEKKVKVHARTHVRTHRYMHGISWPLFDAVDEFVLWHDREPVVYIIPSGLLEQQWIKAGRPTSEMNVTQWVINLRANDGVFETPYFWIGDYGRRIPRECQCVAASTA